MFSRHGQVRVQRVALEDHRDVAVARLRVVTSRGPMWMRPAVGISRPASRRSAVVLPQPGRPEHREERPVGDVQVERLERLRARRTTSRRPA